MIFYPTYRFLKVGERIRETDQYLNSVGSWTLISEVGFIVGKKVKKKKAVRRKIGCKVIHDPSFTIEQLLNKEAIRIEKRLYADSLKPSSFWNINSILERCSSAK